VAIRGEVTVRAPYARVAEALLLNPGRALGLAILAGGGDEMLAPTVRAGEGTVSVERQRITVDVHRSSTFDPLVDHVTAVRTETRTDTGLTRVEAAHDGGRLSVQLLVGLDPVGDYRTMVRWLGELRGLPRSLAGVARIALGLAQRPQRVRTALEGMADQASSAPGTVDPAVARFRELSASA
jgi:hypothetical protein